MGAFWDGVKRRWWLIVLGLAWVLMGGLTYTRAMVAYGDPFQAERLARGGARTNAAITDVAKGTGHDGKPVWQVRYEFLDASTRKRTAALVIADEAAVKRLEKTGVATARYLASNPEVSTLEGHRRPALSMEAAFGLWSLLMLGCLPLGLTLALAARDAWRERAAAV